MLETGIDLLAIPPSDDLKYLTGFSPHADERPCYLFIAENRGLFLVPDLNANQSERHIRQPFVTYGDAQGPARALAAARNQFRTPRKIGVGDTMRADALLLLQDLWRETAFVPASTILAPLRMRKAPDEISALRRVAATADAAIEAASKPPVLAPPNARSQRRPERGSTAPGRAKSSPPLSAPAPTQPTHTTRPATAG